MEVVHTVVFFNGYMAYKGVIMSGKERRTTRENESKHLKGSNEETQLPYSVRLRTRGNGTKVM